MVHEIMKNDLKLVEFELWAPLKGIYNLKNCDFYPNALAQFQNIYNVDRATILTHLVMLML